MIHRQACPQCLLIVHIGNNNQSFCHGPSRKVAFVELRALPRCCKRWASEGLILPGLALRNYKIDNHLSMTLVNQRDKSTVSLSAVCYSMGDKHSPCTQTMSPICQRHKNILAAPICITLWTTNAIDWNIDYCIMEEREVPPDRLIFMFSFFDLSGHILHFLK